MKAFIEYAQSLSPEQQAGIAFAIFLLLTLGLVLGERKKG